MYQETNTIMKKQSKNFSFNMPLIGNNISNGKTELFGHAAVSGVGYFFPSEVEKDMTDFIEFDIDNIELSDADKDSTKSGMVAYRLADNIIALDTLVNEMCYPNIAKLFAVEIEAAKSESDDCNNELSHYDEAQADLRSEFILNHRD